MKWFYKLAIAFIIGIIFYIIGNVIPIKEFKFTIEHTPIRTAEYYALIIRAIAAFATFLAVVVALFKEDIRRLWEFAKIEVSMADEHFFEVLNSNIGNSNNDSPQLLESEKYVCKIDIHNAGNITALGVEIQLESLLFKGAGSLSYQNIEVPDSHCKLQKIKNDFVTLPPGNIKSINILELIGSVQQSLPKGNGAVIPAAPKLLFVGIENNASFVNGFWKATFVIYSPNTKPTRFTLEANWNGKWEKRATEMKNNLSISLISKKI
jgi:hypothetical protein